jgi:hypothetical protein
MEQRRVPEQEHWLPLTVVDAVYVDLRFDRIGVTTRA